MGKEIEELIDLLGSRDNSQAYQALKMLQGMSMESDRVYPYMDKFVEMIDDDNSYVRTRGLALIACNAKWDVAGKIDCSINLYLEHILDEKPICARQCIKLLPLIAEAKPQLAPEIVSTLRHADVIRYAGSMRPLVQKDVRDALLAIES